MVWFGVVLFSSGPLLVAGATITGTAFSFWRLWSGVAILGVATAVSRVRRPVPLTVRGVTYAAGCGVSFAVHQVLLMEAVQATSVVDVTLMNAVTPVIVGILVFLVFGERPGRAFALWSTIAMAGAAALALAGASGPSGDAFGMLLAVGNTLFYAMYFVGSKVSREMVGTVHFLFVVTITAACTVSAWVVVSGTAVTPVGSDDVVRILTMALLPGALGHAVITWSLRFVPANLPPVVMLSMPVISGLAAWALLDQPIRLPQVAAGAFTILGVLGALRSPPPVPPLAEPSVPPEP